MNQIIEINYQNYRMMIDLFESLMDPNYLITGGLTFLILGCGFRRAFYHPATLMNVNYEDPVTLYAFLNQTCGTQIIPDNKSGLKLIQNFPGVDIQNFIDKYGSLLPNDGAGLIEAQQQLATSSSLWKIGHPMPIVPKQSFIEYFLQDAQITGIIQASNGNMNLGLCNLGLDATLLGVTMIGVPLISYYTSGILLELGTTAGTMITDPLSVECLKWWGSALTSFTLIKNLLTMSEYALIIPCKMFQFMKWGVYECKPLNPWIADSIYKSAAMGASLKYPIIIDGNVLFNKVLIGNYPAINNSLVFARAEWLTPIATGFQSLSILSNLGWELSSSLVDTPLTSTLIENIDITNSNGQHQLQLCNG